MDSQEGLHPAFAVHFLFSLSQSEAAARGVNLLWSLQKLSPPAALTASINANSAISWITAPAGCNAILPATAFYAALVWGLTPREWGEDPDFQLISRNAQYLPIVIQGRTRPRQRRNERRAKRGFLTEVPRGDANLRSEDLLTPRVFPHIWWKC